MSGDELLLPVVSTLDGTEVFRAVRSSGAAVQVPVTAVRAEIGGEVSVAGYGAAVDGVTNDSTAISAMATAAGFVRFPVGNTYVAANLTVSVPVIFDEGAYLTVASTFTVTFSSRVESPRQSIFRGSGLVSLTGEDSRRAHASWFGAFPDGANCAANLNALTTAMGNSREALVEFDPGVYQVNSTVTWNRGSHLLGSGDRLTVFKSGSLTGDVFTTAGIACWFERIQFEIDSAVGTERTSGAYLNIAHGNAIVSDIAFGGAAVGIKLGASNSHARNIRCLVGGTAGAGTATVLVTAGDCTVDDVHQLGGTYTGPEYVVAVRNDSAAVSNVNIRNVFNGTAGSGVGIVSNGQFVSGVTVAGVHQRTGTTSPSAVTVSNIGAQTIDSVRITDVFVNAATTDGIIISSTNGAITDVIVNDVITQAISGTGIKITRTSGTVSVRIGTVDVSRAGTTISQTGSPTVTTLVDSATTIAIASGGTGSITRKAAKTALGLVFDATVLDDNVMIVDLGTTVFNLLFALSGNGTGAPRGLFAARAATGPFCASIVSTGGTVTATTGALAGTTGADGTVTVSADTTGKLYVENRSGSTYRYTVAVFEAQS